MSMRVDVGPQFIENAIDDLLSCAAGDVLAGWRLAVAGYVSYCHLTAPEAEILTEEAMS